MTGPNVYSKTDAAQLRYQVSVPMGVHARISRAAKAANVSEGQYVQALFAGLAVPQIGKVHVTSDRPEVDAMRHLTGTVKIVPTGKDGKQPSGPVPVSENALLRRGLNARARQLYARFCVLSRGRSVNVKLDEIAIKTGCNRANLSTYIQSLEAEGLIFYQRGSGVRASTITAPFTGEVEQEKSQQDGPETPVHNGNTVPESELRALRLSPECIWLYRCLCTLSDGVRLEIESAKLCCEAGIKYGSLMKYLVILRKHGVIYYSSGTKKKPGVIVAPVAREVGV